MHILKVINAYYAHMAVFQSFKVIKIVALSISIPKLSNLTRFRSDLEIEFEPVTRHVNGTGVENTLAFGRWNGQ